MPGTCDFQISGQITYIQDNPPVSGRPYGSFRIRLKIPIQYIGQRAIQEHSIFVGIKYGTPDITNPRFNTLKASLANGKFLFMRGSIKPRDASADGKYPASLFVDAPWRQVKVQDLPFPVRNKVFFDGELVGVNGNRVTLKYTYTNPKEQDPKERWKERFYEMVVSPEADIHVNNGDNVFIEGRIFGVAPDGAQMVWMLLDEVY